MTDLEPSSGPDDDSAGFGLTAFLNSTKGVVSSITALIVAISGLLIALNKTGILGGNASSKTTTEPANSLFDTVKRPTGRVYFDGTTMYVKTKKPHNPLLLLANQDKELQDVKMSMSVNWISGAEDYGYSLLCRYRNSRNYYLVGVLSGGRYEIGRYREGVLTFLRRGQRNYIDQSKNDVTVRCVGDDPTTLTLDVNGRTVESVKDPTGLGAGTVGLRVGSDESTVTLSFKDFFLNSF